METSEWFQGFIERGSSKVLCLKKFKNLGLGLTNAVLSQFQVIITTVKCKSTVSLQQETFGIGKKEHVSISTNSCSH